MWVTQLLWNSLLKFIDFAVCKVLPVVSAFLMKRGRVEFLSYFHVNFTPTLKVFSELTHSLEVQKAVRDFNIAAEAPAPSGPTSENISVRIQLTKCRHKRKNKFLMRSSLQSEHYLVYSLSHVNGQCHGHLPSSWRWWKRQEKQPGMRNLPWELWPWTGKWETQKCYTLILAAFVWTEKNQTSWVSVLSTVWRIKICKKNNNNIHWFIGVDSQRDLDNKRK